MTILHNASISRAIKTISTIFKRARKCRTSNSLLIDLPAYNWRRSNGQTQLTQRDARSQRDWKFPFGIDSNFRTASMLNFVDLDTSFFYSHSTAPADQLKYLRVCDCLLQNLAAGVQRTWVPGCSGRGDSCSCRRCPWTASTSTGRPSRPSRRRTFASELHRWVLLFNPAEKSIRLRALPSVRNCCTYHREKF